MKALYDPIEWTNQLVTGVAEIDKQHRFLVDAINDANGKLQGSPDIKLLEQITKDLLSYAIYHFETEEDLMLEYGYKEESAADAELHQKQHREFSAQVIAVRDGLRDGKLISREDLLAFLNGWLVNHIMNTDQRLGIFIRQKRNTATAR
ncbi:MAG: bacteriohemerythrin [Azonexus sp.]|nr:bacteriohemerythrin [Azonexus sp.]